MGSMSVEFECNDCCWSYNGDQTHMYVILKHIDKHYDNLIVEELDG